MKANIGKKRIGLKAKSTTTTTSTNTTTTTTITTTGPIQTRQVCQAHLLMLSRAVKANKICQIAHSSTLSMAASLLAVSFQRSICQSVKLSSSSSSLLLKPLQIVGKQFQHNHHHHKQSLLVAHSGEVQSIASCNRFLTTTTSMRITTTHPETPTTTMGESGEKGENQINMQTILLTNPSKHVAHIHLNRPKAKNAFGLDTASELISTLKQLEADSKIRCVLLSGNGPDLTSGVDIKSFMGLYQQLQNTEDIAHRAKLLRKTVEKFQEPFKQMYAFEKPMICIQHGLSLGLGMELAACCDIRYCSRDAKMAIREVLIGIAADVGSLQLMPRLAAANQSLLSELIYTGRFMTPDEALAMGFVSHIGETKESTIAKALGVAEIIAQRSPVAVQGSKRNMQFSRDKPFHVGLDYNAIWNAAMMQGNDLVKAIGAIMAKDDKVEYEDF